VNFADRLQTRDKIKCFLADHTNGRAYATVLRPSVAVCNVLWGNTAAAPPPFRLGDPALCGSHPVVTP